MSDSIIAQADWLPLDALVKTGEIQLGRGNIISALDIAADEGSYPIYSSSAASTGEFGRYGKFMFDEELITWSVDGGGRPFHRKKHRFSVTNVGGFLRIKAHEKWDYRFVHALLQLQHSRMTFDWLMKAHPSVIRMLYKIPVVPLEEQRRIAEILDTIDETIQATECVIAKLEKEKIGVLSAELATLQSNTSWLTVDETFDVSNGITLNPSRAPKANATKYLRVANVRRGSLDISDVSSMEATTSEQSNKCLLPGDLLVIEGHADPNEIGRCALATKEVAGFVFQNHLFRLRPKTMISEFGEIWLNSDNSRRYWRKMCSTSSGLHTINRTMLRSVPVPETTPQDQKRVVSVAAAAKLRLGAETDRLEKLRSTRSGLAADLLSGRVRTVAS
jgi:Type I restriction modification DNA specificity domain